MCMSDSIAKIKDRTGDEDKCMYREKEDEKGKINRTIARIFVDRIFMIIIFFS